jgi:Ubiquitin-protein ligase
MLSKISPSSISLKRIISDLRENKKNPISNVSICNPTDDLYTLHGNVRICDGLYKDLIIHIIINLPNDYPITGPAVNIAPGINFGHKFHEHIFDDSINGNSICNDLLTNFALWFNSTNKNQKKVATGWSSGYTLTTILMQLAVFFSDPDLPMNKLPSENDIEKLRNELNTYQCNVCNHKTIDPYPPFIETNEIIENKKEKNYEKILNQARNSILCGVTKSNIIDNDSVILGYPLLLNRDKFGRLWPTPIMELISYDAYILEIQKSGIECLDKFDRTRFVSPMGQIYNYWIPCYFTEKHFRLGYTIISNAISIIKNGITGTIENDFRPEMILDVLPTIINKTVVHLMNGTLYESKKAIETYCHFLRLLMAFIDEFPQLQGIINDKVSKFIYHRSYRNKKYVSDIGEFLILLFLSNKKYTDDDVRDSLYEEYFSRQIYWINKNNPNNLSKKLSTRERLEKCFQSDINFK